MADLAQRLDVTGRRIVVLAGPGDRRDEDLVAIAHAVAGRFDHYICRRDDGLRDRAPDEVPRLQAAALRAAGVPEGAISIIPDEQEAVDAALNMGEAGDLLLVFADALVRSWKQITKFKPASAVTSASSGATGQVGRGPGEGLSPMPIPAPQPTPAAVAEGAESPSAFNLDGMIRDERGIRYAPETED
jgi:cyanophycin synthetase